MSFKYELYIHYRVNHIFTQVEMINFYFYFELERESSKKFGLRPKNVKLQ